VACADRDAGAAEATAALVRDEGQAAAVVLADVAAPDACAPVVADPAAAPGGRDGLVLNVGTGLGRGMAGTSAAQRDQRFAVSTRAHFLVAAAAAEALEPGSAIVVISSAASLRAASMRTHWSSTAARPASANRPGGTRPLCLRALPFHGQFGQTAGHRTGTHPKLPGRDCEPHRGKARQQLREDRLQFDPGQRGAETAAGAVPEQEMGRPFAGDVEAIGAGKNRGIVVGGARIQQHQAARAHGDLPDLQAGTGAAGNAAAAPSPGHAIPPAPRW
jgi:hypothetical protein